MRSARLSEPSRAATSLDAKTPHAISSRAALSPSPQVPTLIAKIDAALAGQRSVVVGLQLTGFAAAERAAKRQAAAAFGGGDGDDEGGDDGDEAGEGEPVAGAADAMGLCVKYAFEPVADDGSGGGKAPMCRAEYDGLLRAITDLKLPRGALDALVLHYGPDAVAEITGRRARSVPERGAGGVHYVWRTRPSDSKKAERGELPAPRVACTARPGHDPRPLTRALLPLRARRPSRARLGPLPTACALPLNPSPSPEPPLP